MSARSRLGETFGSTFSSLRTRNYRLFFVGQFVSNTGNWLTNVALTLLVLHLTNSGFAIGLVTACQYGPILLFSVWAGAIADRYDKRRLLFVTQGLEMVESFVLAALAFMPHPPLPALYLVAASGGILLAFDNPLRRSFVTEMVPAEDISNAVVLYSTVINLSRIIGPALAGLLVVTVGYGWGFTVDGISYLAVLATLWMMRPSELLRRPPKPRAKGEIRAGVRYVLATPVLWIPFAMLAVIGTLAYNLTVTLPLFVTHALHSSEGVFTILYSVFSTGAVVSGLLVAHRRLVEVRHIIIGAVGLGVALLGLPAVPGVGFAVPAVFLVGMTSILYMTSTTAIVQVETVPSMHGRVLALQTVLIVGTAPIGGPFLGWLADAFGARAPVVLGGVACLAAGAFGYVATRRVARQSATTELEDPLQLDQTLR